MTWFNSLSPNVQAALIGAIVALLVTFIKEFAIALWRERKQSEKDLSVIFQKYADPLSAAATSLLWRLNEVFSTEGRGAYLKADVPPNTYNNYKKVSTLYRLASVIGWIRAFKRELSYLRVRNPDRFQSIHEAIHEFEKALADGPQIELERLDLLGSLWSLNLPTGKSERSALGVELEHSVHREFHNECIDGSATVSLEVKQRICAQIAVALCNRLGSAPLSTGLINDTGAKAFDILTIKETWFYRDWQVALGDIMVEEVSGSSRRFDVIGFGEFECFWLAEEENKKIWLSRLNEIIDDLDVSITGDCRVTQLRNILEATARLVLALANISTSRGIIADDTLRAAERVLSRAKPKGHLPS